ncbi:MAG: hypothetical protein ACXWMJ_04600 [Syntrophales bacterium]
MRIFGDAFRGCLWSVPEPYAFLWKWREFFTGRYVVRLSFTGGRYGRGCCWT